MFNWGGFCFGLVVGWITYRTLRRAQTNGLSDISTVIGAVGGAAVVSLFPQAGDAFTAYCIGLAAGFFGYLLGSGLIDWLAASVPGAKRLSEWLGNPVLSAGPRSSNPGELPRAGGG